jgi:hypothetical protein
VRLSFSVIFWKWWNYNSLFGALSEARELRWLGMIWIRRLIAILTVASSPSHSHSSSLSIENSSNDGNAGGGLIPNCMS